MLKGFKEFLLRGNVVDLAVAVVIGAAFNSIVDRFVEALINPVIGMVFRADSLDGALQVSLPGGGTLAFGAVIGAIINFLIVAAVVYFVFVMPMNTLRERTKKEDEPETPAGETEQELLTQIRDLMREQQAQAAQGPQTVPVQDPAQTTSADETPRGSHGAHGA